MKASDKVWITGAGGLIGRYLVQTCPSSHRAIGLHRSDLNLLDAPALEDRFHTDQPCGVIHAAAISKSPACQANPDLAWRTNVATTRQLAGLASSIPFFFISTDLVFDGQKGNYVETDVTKPLSFYGKTKAEAEQHVLANPRHTVIRTSLNGGQSPTGDRGFNEELHHTIRSGKTAHLFTDEFPNPMPAVVTALALWELYGKQAAGIFHLAGAEKLSRYQIGQLLTETWNEGHQQICASTLKDYKGAPRAPDTSLCSDKAQRLLSFPLPAFGSWLKAQTNHAF